MKTPSAPTSPTSWEKSTSSFHRFLSKQCFTNVSVFPREGGDKHKKYYEVRIIKLCFFVFSPRGAPRLWRRPITTLARSCTPNLSRCTVFLPADEGVLGHGAQANHRAVELFLISTSIQPKLHDSDKWDVTFFWKVLTFQNKCICLF